MTKYLTIAILFLAPLLSIGHTAKKITKTCLPLTVSLVLDNYKQPISLGSGFIIDNGKIITNLHIIEGAKYGYVIVTGNDEKYKI